MNIAAQIMSLPARASNDVDPSSSLASALTHPVFAFALLAGTVIALPRYIRSAVHESSPEWSKVNQIDGSLIESTRGDIVVAWVALAVLVAMIVAETAFALWTLQR